MNVLLKNIQLIAPRHPFNGKKINILISEGKIKKIGKEIKAPKNAVTPDVEGACVSIGWMDIGVQTGEPGFEHREDLESICNAAAAGGYTALACQPNTSPIIHSRSEVQYIQNNGKDKIVNFYPIGALSQNCEGKDMSEMYDMHQAGAIAFSDGKHPIQNAGLMMRSLQYVKAFDGIIINEGLDASIVDNGQMNEGEHSTLLGMKGIPHLAEDLMVQRDLYLTEYTQSRLHIANVSTASSVELIRNAKQRGLKVTASVPVLNLAYKDEEMLKFNTNFKVLPPLRGEEDVQALRAGVKDGTIDLVVSNHVPLEQEVKNLEFAYAKFGAIGLETCFGLANHTLNKILTYKKLVERFAYTPRKLFSIPIPEIKEGAMANLTVFHPTKKWTFTKKDIYSKSENSPLIGKELKGKVLAVFNNGKNFLFQ